MKTNFLIIIGVVLIITITSAFILNYYIPERNYESKNTPDQLKAVLVSCACESKINAYPEPDELCIGPAKAWQNLTHHIDSNTCKLQTIEKHESDIQIRDALGRCWIGNNKFLDDDFIPWSNETHYIDVDTCLITETSSESKVTDSLKIQNTERDAKLAAGYKLYPGVGLVNPYEQKNSTEPIYIDNTNNAGELILDIDTMIQVQKILEKCDYIQKLESGEIPWRNPDGSFNVIHGDLPFFNNGTHYIDSNYCNWVDSLKSITYNCFEANPMEQNWYSGPNYFDNGTHYLDAQKCEWIVYSEEYSDLPLCDSNPERNFSKCREFP